MGNTAWEKVGKQTRNQTGRQSGGHGGEGCFLLFFFSLLFPRRAVSGLQQKCGGSDAKYFYLGQSPVMHASPRVTHRPSPSIRKEVVREGTGPVVGKLKISLRRGGSPSKGGPASSKSKLLAKDV